MNTKVAFIVGNISLLTSCQRGAPRFSELRSTKREGRYSVAGILGADDVDENDGDDHISTHRLRLDLPPLPLPAFGGLS